jgi:hypothetical protein
MWMGKEWLKMKWMWEELRKDKGIETKAFNLGTYDHPMSTNELRQVNPNDRHSPYESKITAINYKQVYEIPFTKENYEKVLAERSDPREEKHINMKTVKNWPLRPEKSFRFSSHKSGPIP